jgi:hypothetical protein
LSPWEIARLAKRVRELAREGKVEFTLKALRELAAGGFGEIDACEILTELRPPAFVDRIESRATGEWMYVFKPRIEGLTVYVKLIMRSGCVVVSFHEDDSGDDEDGST